MQQFVKFKGKPNLFRKLQVSLHEEFLISLPILFNFQDIPKLPKDELQGYIIQSTNTIVSEFMKLKSNVTIKWIKNILRLVWPILIYKVNPQKFKEHVQFLRKQLDLTPQHACFMIHYSYKFPEKYPSFCRETTLQVFQIQQKLLSNCLLLDPLIGEECLEAYLLIEKFEVCSEITLAQQNEFIQEQFMPSSMSSILKILLNRKTNVVKLLNSLSKDANFIAKLDQWFSPDTNNEHVNLWRTLKIILSIEAFYEVKCKPSQEQAKVAGISVVYEAADRLTNKLFSYNYKETVLILDWILQSNIWAQNTEMKNKLIHHLITCYEIQCRKPQNPIALLQKIQNSKTELITKYILKIKLKHFASIKFRSKVPKSYLNANLRLIQTGNSRQENDSYMMKMGTSTASLSKGNGTESLDKQAINATSTNSKSSNLDKLLVSITKYSQNLQLSKIYIISLIIQQQLTKQDTQDETDTEINQPYIFKYGSLYRKIYYLIAKSIRSYEQIFKPNILTVEIMKIVSVFATKFVDGNIQEIYHSQWVDLQIIVGNQLTLQNLSNKILVNKIYYRLQTIYQMEQAQNVYEKQNSQNQKPMLSKQLMNKREKHLDKISPKPQFFQRTIYQMMMPYVNKVFEFELLEALICVADPKVHQTLFLNLVFYTLAKRMKSKQDFNKIEQVEVLLKQLFKYYLTPKMKQNKKSVIQLLTKGHKIMAYWGRCTRRSLQKIEGSLTDSLPLRGHELQKFVAKKYWQLLISSTQLKNSNLQAYAKHYKQFNCIKQSIYLLGLRQSQRFQQQKIDQLYDMFARLEGSLINSKSHIINELTQKDTFKSITKQEKPFRQHYNTGQGQHWYEDLKYLTEYPTLSTYSTILSKMSHKLCSLQDPQELNKILNEACVFSTYYQSLQQKNYIKIQSIMELYSHRAINMSIVQCLKQTKRQIQEKSNVPQHLEGLQTTKLMELVSELAKIIYTELVRLDEIDTLEKEVEAVPVQDKSKEQLKIAIIVYHKLKKYNKVRVHFREVSKRFKQMRPELQFYNIEACIKSISYYPSDEMIQSLNKIIVYIENEKQASKINKNFTQPLFQAFKFMCSNYKNLTFEQQKKVLTYLNRYLNKCESVRNHLLAKEACYFILRFILLDSSSTEQLCGDPNSFEVQKYNASIMEPHLSLLISSIGDNDKINEFIKNILIKIAQHDPKASVWWIFALRSHCRTFKGMEPAKRHPFDEIDKNIQIMGQNIYSELKRKFINLDSELNWISQFVSVEADEKLKLQKMPSGMVSPFSKQMIIQKLIKVSNVGSGKSKPVMIQIKVNFKKTSKVVKFIRKNLQNCKSGFRTESATANFFKDSAILDPAVTYSIIHLSKYCILLEYVENKSTLDRVMTQDLSISQSTKIGKLMTIKQSILGKNFDKLEFHIQFNLTKFLYEGSSVQHWWIKYTNFLKTYAQWCFLCYIVGLGDRHTNNVLVTEEGKVIQIDFQYILDIGKMLPYPEWVPFRLTRGLLSQFSIIEPYGLLFSEFVETANRYREKQREIWHALSHFSYLKKKNVPELINQRAQLNNQFYEQSLTLFKEATDPMLLRDMFKGWASYK